MYSSCYYFLILTTLVFENSKAWTYELQRGWREMCSQGRTQSPIPLPLLADMPLRADVKKHYRTVPLKLVDDGHTVRIDLRGAGFLTVPNSFSKWQIDNMNFHTPSEHWIGNYQYDMEVRMEHVNERGQKLMVTVLCDFDEHPNSRWLDSFIGPFVALNTKVGDLQSMTTARNVQYQPPEHYSVDLNEFWDTCMKGLETYYSYEGSIPSPPCTEDVHWVVSGHICLASKQWQSVMGNFVALDQNYRTLQPENGREPEASTSLRSFVGYGQRPEIRGAAKKKKGNVMFPVLLILLLFACCVAAKFFHTNSKDSPEESYRQYVDENVMNSHYNQDKSRGGGYDDHIRVDSQAAGRFSGDHNEEQNIDEYSYNPRRKEPHSLSHKRLHPSQHSSNQYETPSPISRGQDSYNSNDSNKMGPSVEAAYSSRRGRSHQDEDPHYGAQYQPVRRSQQPENYRPSNRNARSDMSQGHSIRNERAGYIQPSRPRYSESVDPRSRRNQQNLDYQDYHAPDNRAPDPRSRSQYSTQQNDHR